MIALMAESEEWKNPANWSWLGPQTFLTLVFAVALLVFVWKALGKWDRHLERQEKLQKSQLTLCTHVHAPSGSANVSDIRDAIPTATEVAQIMADGIGDDTGRAVKPLLAKIIETTKLRPSPMPTVYSEPATDNQ